MGSESSWSWAVSICGDRRTALGAMVYYNGDVGSPSPAQQDSTLKGPFHAPGSWPSVPGQTQSSRKPAFLNPGYRWKGCHQLWSAMPPLSQRWLSSRGCEGIMAASPPLPCTMVLQSFCAHGISACSHVFILHIPGDTVQDAGDATRVKTDMVPSQGSRYFTGQCRHKRQLPCGGMQ